MKKISRRNFLKIAASTTALGALTACGSTNTSSTTSTSTATGNSTSGEDSNFNATGMPIVNEKMTFNILVYQAATSQCPVEEKLIFSVLEEETNVELIFEEVPASAWEQKVNLAISTGQTPDAIMAGQIVDIASAINAELITPLDDYMQYMPNLEHIFELYPSAQGATSYMGDDKHYFYPCVSSKAHAECRAPLFINQNWLDTLGLPQPTTTDEFYDTLLAFRDGDPNGNDDADEIGFSSFSGYFGLMFKDLFGAWDMMGIKNPVETTVRDGVLDFNPVTDNYRQAMTYFHQLYTDGLMDPEVITLDESTKNAKLSMEPSIYGAAQEWSTATFGPNASQYEALLPLIGPEGAQKYTVNDPYPVSQAMVVFNTCKNPEVLFRYMDHANEGLNALIAHLGPVGDLYEVDEDAMTFRLRETEYAETGEAIETYRPTLGMNSNFTTFTAAGFTEIKDPKAAGLLKYGYSDAYRPYFFTDQYPTSVPIPVVDADSKQIKLLEEELTVYLDAFATDFILKGMDDAKWAAHLQKCKELNYEKVVAYYQKIYNSAYGI